VLHDGPSLLWVPAVEWLEEAVLCFIRSCLQGYFGHQMKTSLSIAGFKFIGKQNVVKVPEGGPRYDTTIGLIVNIFMTNHSTASVV
jgi:hypothetical protein